LFCFFCFVCLNANSAVVESGLPDGIYFQTKNPHLGKFWRALLWKVLVYFMTIWSILRPVGIFDRLSGIFSQLRHVVPWKIWQPCCRRVSFVDGSKRWCRIISLFLLLGKIAFLVFLAVVGSRGTCMCGCTWVHQSAEARSSRDSGASGNERK
jgi:hypothetical protein